MNSQERKANIYMQFNTFGAYVDFRDVEFKCIRRLIISVEYTLKQKNFFNT